MSGHINDQQMIVREMRCDERKLKVGAEDAMEQDDCLLGGWVERDMGKLLIEEGIAGTRYGVLAGYFHHRL